MNRRDFVTKLLGVTVGALVTKNVNSAPQLTLKPVPIEEGPFFPLDYKGVDGDSRLTGNEEALGFYGGDQWTNRQKHQMEMNRWLRKKVDDAAFKMMTS